MKLLYFGSHVVCPQIALFFLNDEPLHDLIFRPHRSDLPSIQSSSKTECYENELQRVPYWAFWTVSYYGYEAPKRGTDKIICWKILS